MNGANLDKPVLCQIIVGECWPSNSGKNNTKQQDGTALLRWVASRGRNCIGRFSLFSYVTTGSAYPPRALSLLLKKALTMSWLGLRVEITNFAECGVTFVHCFCARCSPYFQGSTSTVNCFSRKYRSEETAQRRLPLRRGSLEAGEGS